MPRENLYIYLAVSNSAESSALNSVSHALLHTEIRYPIIERVDLALVISARKLRSYFQAYTIIMLIN